MAGNNLVYIILDSCRFDSLVRAKTPNMDRIGTAESRYSFASWTAPSHFSLLMGQVPHNSPRRVFASEVYKTQFAQWVDRHEALDLELVVVATADQAVAHGDVMTAGRKMQRRRPTEEAVTAEYEDAHDLTHFNGDRWRCVVVPRQPDRCTA